MYASLLFGYNRFGFGFGFGFDSTKEIQIKKPKKETSVSSWPHPVACFHLHPSLSTRRQALGQQQFLAWTAVLGLEQVRPPCVLLAALGWSCCCYTSALVRPRRPRCLTTLAPASSLSDGAQMALASSSSGGALLGSRFVVLPWRAGGLQLHRSPVAHRWL